MGNANSTLVVRVNEEDKNQAGAILEALGTNLSAAVNMMLKQIIINNGLPFSVSGPKNDATFIAGLTDKLHGSVPAIESDLNEIREERLQKYETTD